MKEIKLTQGKVALVDDEDFDHLNQWKWYAAKYDGNIYYAQRRFYSNGRGTTIKMHRQIMNPPEGTGIDHIDHDGLNNQKNNLRECNNSQNQMNRRANRNSEAKYKGVNRHEVKDGNKTYFSWHAGIQFNKQRFSLGCFKTKEEAALAYNKKATELFGEFATINDIKYG